MAYKPKHVEPSASFTDILDTPMSQIAPPKPMPPGDYTAMVVGQPNEDVATTGTRYVQFTMQLQEAHENVNGDALQEALTKLDGTVMALREKTILSDRYYLTDPSLFRLKNFLKDLGIEGVESEKPLREAMSEAPGKLVVVTIVHRPSQSGGIYANVSQTSPVE